MSRPDPNASRPIGEAEALAALSRLARRGAYAIPSADAGDTVDYAVFSPRNAFSAAIALLSAGTVAFGLEQRWLVRADDGRRLTLSDLGARVLRRARSGSTGSVFLKKAASTRPARSQSPAVPQRPAATTPLAWPRRRRDKQGRPLITEAQFNAGERLALDFWRGQLSPPVTANWSAAAPSRRMRRGAPGAGIDLADSLVAARDRVHRALAAVGPELADILVNVCCHDMGLEVAGRAEGWPERAAKVVLQLALTRLARHYGLIAPEPARAVSVRHWADEDYRPNLAGWR